MAYLDPETIKVPTQDSAANSFMQDVIGNKTDTHSGDSLYSYIKALHAHADTKSSVYPSLANGVVVTAGAAWTLGVFAEIVPAGAIGTEFMIHYVGVEALSANEVYQLVLYKGALGSEIEIGSVRFTKNAVQAGTDNQPMLTKLIAANERISAKVATAGGSDTATISVFYHTH